LAKKLSEKLSILLWTLKTYKKTQALYSTVMKDERYLHIRFDRLRNSREMKQFLANLG
ncbi:adenylate kinase, partial [Pseudoalteromonas sp. S3776]